MLESTYNRNCNLLNELRKNGIQKTNLKINIKFLNNLRPEWKRFATNIIQNKDLSELDIHVLYENVNRNQEEVLENQEIKKQAEKPVVDPLALGADRKHKHSSRRSTYNKDQSELLEEGTEDSDSDVDLQELKKAMVLLTKAFKNKKFYKKPSSNKLRSLSEYRKLDGKVKIDEKKSEGSKRYDNKKNSDKQTDDVPKCYYYGKLGHYAKE